MQDGPLLYKDIERCPVTLKEDPVVYVQWNILNDLRQARILAARGVMMEVAEKVKDLLNEESKGFEIALLEQLATWLNNQEILSHQLLVKQVVIGAAGYRKWVIEKRIS